MKKLMFATALVASAAAFAAPLNATSFEGYTAGNAVIGAGGGDVGETGAGNNYFCYEGDQDGSLVKAYGVDDNLTAPTITRPLYFADAAPNANYLELSTEGGILWRSIDPIQSYTVDNTTTYSNGAPVAVASDGTYLDTLVQFTPTEDGGAPELDAEVDKLAIWLNVDSQGHTNLMVRAAVVNVDGEPTATTFTITNKTVCAGTWYRLTIKAIPDISDGDEIPGFQIRLDGDVLMSDTPTLESEYLELKADSEYGVDLLNGALFASLLGTASNPTLQGVGFKGSGALDDIVWTTEDPFDVPAVAFTLTWPTGITPVSYSIDGGTAESLTGQSSPFSIPNGGVVPGSTVVFTFTNADGATKTMSVVSSSSVNGINAEDAVWEWADYLGAAVDGAYTIDDGNDLVMLSKGVFSGLATSGETFKQSANIDMTGVADFYGIGWFTSSESYASLPAGVTNKQDTAFAGTYDGQGYTIANVTIVKHSYAGVFNNVEGTVKDLTVQDIGLSGTCTEWGCAIVGNSQRSAVLENLTAVASSGFNWGDSANHNVAGIVVRPVDSSIIRGCVNNVAISAVAKRVGGIAAFVGNGPAGTKNVQFFNCTNNAALVSTDGTRGVGGILGCAEGGTTATATIITGCVDFGSETAQASGGHAGAIVGSNWNGSNTYTDGGGNTFKAASPVCGYVKNPVFDLAYATASTIDGTAYLTTVKAADLAAGNTYTLLQNVAASETPVFTLTAVGDTIAFDTALGYTFAGTVAGSGAAGYPTASTSGTVITYTAGYFPRTATAGQDGSAANPFEIADVDDLQALAAAVAAGVGSGNYVQIADIDMSTAGAFAGIGAAGQENDATLTASAFEGVYDGGNKTISNITFTNRKGSGLFNLVRNATIKDLTIDTVSYEAPFAASKLGGAMFVGNGVNCTLQHLVTLGNNGLNNPSTYNAAGIANRLEGRGGPVLVIGCTNNAAIYCVYSKVAGICPIVQGANQTVTFVDCANTGSIVANGTAAQITLSGKTPGTDGAAGIVAYSQGGSAGDLSLTNCVNTGTISGVSGTTIGTILGKMGSSGVVAVGGSAQSAVPSIGAGADKVTGLKFATVDNDVASFVADGALALNGSYKVMAASATATYAFAEAGTLAFDTNMVQAVTFAITAAEGLTLTDATSAGVVTFTAGAPAPAYPTYLTDADADVKANYDAWKVTNGADANSEYEKQFLLNTAPATAVPATALAITAIEQDATAGWNITVECTIQGVDLTGTVGTAKAGNGYLAVSYTDDLGGSWTTENINITASANGKVTVNVNKANAKFMKVKLSSTAEPAAQN